jgi:ABC-type Co2+ transport system permease subunit
LFGAALCARQVRNDTERRKENRNGLKSLSFVTAFFNGALLIDISPIGGGLIVVLIGIALIDIALLISAVFRSVQVQDKFVYVVAGNLVVVKRW